MFALFLTTQSPPLPVALTCTPRPQSLCESVMRQAAHLEKRHVRTTSGAPQSEPERRWVARHPVLTGALAGATVGIIWADVACRGACEGDPRPYMALFGGIGAGIGAGTGAVISAIVR
jgi:hypothetical protein